MRVLATFPGKFGDIIWALPALRALSRRIGAPVDLLVAAPYGSICSLIEVQDYIGACWADTRWQVQDTAPMTPRIPVDDLGVPVPAVWQERVAGGSRSGFYDLTLHLGYRGWPTRPLPFETLDCLNTHSEIQGSKWTRFGTIPDEELHLEEPWITVPPQTRLPHAIVIGFTDEHFELKYGLTRLLSLNWAGTPATGFVLVAPGSRMEREAQMEPTDWEENARRLTAGRVALCCCSALHVLAVAVGTPVVLMEPEPMRHHPIFYPLGQDGPQVTLVKGTDGQPTWDARHVAETLEKVLEGRR